MSGRVEPAAGTGPVAGVGHWLADAAALTGRGIRLTRRDPGTLFALTVMPVIFFVFFSYILGSGMSVPGGSYRDYLFPGLLVATITFSTVPAVIAGLHDDLRNGVVDRVRSLPASVSAALVGRAVADNLRNLVGVAVLVVLGLLAGVEFTGRLVALLGGLALLLVYGFAMVWLAAFLTVSLRSLGAAQMIGTAVTGPLGFVSSLYADPSGMPGWLRVVAEHNPASATGDALRAWMSGQTPGGALWYALAWLVTAILVFAGLTIRRVSRGLPANPR